MVVTGAIILRQIFCSEINLSYVDTFTISPIQLSLSHLSNFNPSSFHTFKLHSLKSFMMASSAQRDTFGLTETETRLLLLSTVFVNDDGKVSNARFKNLCPSLDFVLPISSVDILPRVHISIRYTDK